MKKAAFIIMLLTILSKILGFLREVFLAYFYGASNISDAYLISWTIPDIICSFIGIAISTSFIPLYTKIQKKEGVKSSLNYMNNVVSIFMCISIMIIIVAFIFTPGLVRVFASGFEGETYNLAVAFTKISIIGVFFSVLIYVFTSFLQINNNFVIPALIGFPLNLVIITFMVISVRSNVFLLVIGGVLAKFFELLFLIPFLKKYKYKFKIKINFNDKYIKEMILLALPVIIGFSVNQVNVLIDRTIASTICIGGISALNYANKLNSFIHGIFVISLVTVMYPMISKMSVENNMSGLKKTVSEAIRVINLLITPITVGVLIFAEPIVQLLFGRGAFNSQAVKMTSIALFFYSIGMIGFGLREILSRTFYSIQDTKTPMLNGTFGVILNIVLNLVLSKFLGIGGLALATSISALFSTGLLFVSLRNKIGPFGMKNICIVFVKGLFASLIMGIIAKFSYNCLIGSINQNIALIMSIGVGAIVYMTTVYFMRIDDMDILYKFH